jgi:hypothetical protein
MNTEKSGSSKRKNPQTANLPKGDKEPNLNAPIPLYDPSLHEHDEDPECDNKANEVVFKILIDPSKAATKDNLTSKRFKNITNLVSNGNVVVTVYRQMCIDYFEPEGRTKPCDASHRLLSFLRVMSDQARTQYNQVLAEAREEYTEKVEKSNPAEAKKLKAGTIRDFFKFQMKHRLLETEEDEEEFQYADDSWYNQSEVQKKLGENQYLKDIERDIRDFERHVWFLLGETLWSPRHRKVWKEQKIYITTKICKPFKWSMRDYINRVEVLADLLKYMQPPSHISDEFKDADWRMRDDALNAVQIREAILYGLPDELHQRALDKCQDKDIRDVKRARFIDTLLNVEIDDNKVRAKLSQDKILKKKQKTKNGQKDADGAKQWSPRSRSKSREQQPHCGYCKRLGKPDYACRSHSESECNIKKRDERSNDFKNDSKPFTKEKRAMEKELKKLKRRIDKSERQNKALMKIMKKSCNKSDFSKLQRKYSSSDGSDAFSDSSDSKSSSESSK